MSEVTKLKILFFLKFCAEAMFLPFLAIYYKSLGFKELEVFPTLWDEANPCQIYIMGLNI